MHTNHTNAATGAAVPISLGFEKFSHALGFNHLNIFHHTHTITFTIPLVKVCKLLTRHRIALATRLDLMLPKFWAAPFDIAVFASGNATCAMSNVAPLRRNSMSKSKISPANAAVHSAWRNKFRGKFSLTHQTLFCFYGLIVLCFF
jgi:hypothetical protein